MDATASPQPRPGSPAHRLAFYDSQLADPRTAAAIEDAAAVDEEVAKHRGRLASRVKIERANAFEDLASLGFLEPYPAPVEPPKTRPRLTLVEGGPSQGNPLPGSIAPSRPIFRLASEVVAEEQRWLHPGRFPLGTVSLIAGNMGVGKSTFVSSMVTTVTRGACWPDALNFLGPRSVVLIQDEESLSKTQRPRLDRFGADLEKVAFLTAVRRGASDDERGFSITRDVHALDILCDHLGDVALVLLDPLGSFLGGISGFKEGETREALDPLFRFAARRDVCVTAVVHLNKDGEKPIEQRISGSFAMPAKARMVWYLSADPHNRHRRLLSHLKGNLDGKSETALAFGYTDGRITWAPKPLRIDAHQVDLLLRQRAKDEQLGLRTDADRRRSKLPAAKSLILTLLARGPIASADLYRSAVDCGLTESTYRKALAALRDVERRVVEDGDPPVLSVVTGSCAAVGPVVLDGPEGLAAAVWEDDGGRVHDLAT